MLFRADSKTICDGQEAHAVSDTMIEQRPASELNPQPYVSAQHGPSQQPWLLLRDSALYFAALQAQLTSLHSAAARAMQMHARWLHLQLSRCNDTWVLVCPAHEHQGFPITSCTTPKMLPPLDASGLLVESFPGSPQEVNDDAELVISESRLMDWSPSFVV